MVGFDPETVEEMALRRPTVEFRVEVARANVASDEAGVPQFIEKDMARWWYPGEKGNSWDCSVEDFWKRDSRFTELFKLQYEAWKGGNKDAVTGCPIQECPVIPRTIAEQFRYVGFTSVEQLIEAEPTSLVGILEGMEYQKSAKRWYQAAKKTAEKSKLIEENEELKQKLDHLTREMELINKKFITLTGGH